MPLPPIPVPAPVALSLLRHARSAGNEAASVAELAGAEVIDVPCRDPDVPLAPGGEEQARATGRLLAAQPELRPDLVVCSPFVRARETARIALAAAGLEALPLVVDERWRDRDLGVLDTLTRHGIRTRFPAEAARRDWLGKYYYRPPGGESWCDVSQRVRASLGELAVHAQGRRVLVVTHEVPVLVARGLLEGLPEERLLELSRLGYPNASLTTFGPGPDGRPELAGWAELEAGAGA